MTVSFILSIPIVNLIFITISILISTKNNGSNKDNYFCEREELMRVLTTVHKVYESKDPRITERKILKELRKVLGAKKLTPYRGFLVEEIVTREEMLDILSIPQASREKIRKDIRPFIKLKLAEIFFRGIFLYGVVFHIIAILVSSLFI